MMVVYAGILDLVLRDPSWLPHPISAIAVFAKLLEQLTERTQLAGIAVWFAVVGATCGLVWVSLWLVEGPWLQVYWVYSFLAIGSLDRHAMDVIRPLKSLDLPGARQAVAMIVGRDTANLSEREITRAVIETVAENLNDGVVAPLFWLAVAGPVGMAGYKAVNTLDSMFGYKNEKYLHFGWCSARMDDLASWLPARLTAAMIWLVAALSPGQSGLQSIAITLRDAHLQPSPNSGYPEAAVAGAMGIQLGGTNVYNGVVSYKAFLGDDRNALTWRSYTPMRRILFAVSTMAVLMVEGVFWWR